MLYEIFYYVNKFLGYKFLPKGSDLCSCLFLRKINKLNKKDNFSLDMKLIMKGLLFAKAYHGRQRRKSGELYYHHPVIVAGLVSDHSFKTETIITALLHDKIEDTALTKEIIEREFGAVVANQVEALTRDKAHGKVSVRVIVQNAYDKKDDDLLIVKIFDRLHNMRTISAKSPASQYKTTIETMVIFLPLAKYLKIPKIEEELMQLCIATLKSLSTNLTQSYVFPYCGGIS